MTALSDLEANDKARVIARLATDWLARNSSIESMDASADPISCFDDPDQNPETIFYFPTDLSAASDNIQFGYIVMRPGRAAFAKAAVVPYEFDGRFVYIICAVSESPANRTAILAHSIGETNFVHEATHVLDFMRFRRLPKGYRTSDRNDLKRLYYNLPHEFNAFFHQGLDQFRKDLDLVNGELDWAAKNQRLAFKQHIIRKVLYSGYWDDGFTMALNKRFRRKLLRRVFRLLSDLPLSQRADVLSPLMARHFAGEDIRHLPFQPGE